MSSVELDVQPDFRKAIRLRFYEPAKLAPIDGQLSKLINAKIRAFDPHCIILVERKATAIFRSLKESENQDNRLDWAWKDTISSSVIEQLPIDFFENKRVLIFDDMMMKGDHLDDLLTQLHELFGNKIDVKNIKIVVFGIHQYSSSLRKNMKLGLTYPDVWYCRDLSTSSYEQIRYNIVKMLEASGSLLLDTEHIELRIRLKGHLSDLISALNRTGETVVFNSSRNRRNITVFYSSDNVEFDENLFPKNTEFEGIVRKCRVVQRHDDEYAIIPICYPTIQDDEDTIKEWLSNNKALFNNSISSKNFSAFYAVGLVAALQVLKITVKDLIASGFDESNIYLPLDSKEDNPKTGYSLNHLHVMYPQLNLQALIKEINKIFTEGKEWGMSIRGKHIAEDNQFHSNDELLETNAIRLLQVIHFEIQKRISDEYEPEEKIPHPFGLSAKEIFGLAREIGIDDDKIISSLFDILIDKAYLVTHVEKRLDSDNKCVFIRTFEPDGEIISKKIRDLTIDYGLPLGYSKD